MATAPIQLPESVAARPGLVRRYGLDVFWLASIGRALWLSAYPGYWNEGDPTWTYPWVRAAALCALLTAETFALHLFLRPRTYRRSWRRATAALAAFGPLWYWAAAHTVTDQPGAAYVHVGFLSTVVLLLLVCLAVTAAGLWRQRSRGSRARAA